ncbi:uncharacterized protein LOC131233435 isoform X2 [Magnolia sinica]|uniref:uncharacterized protein LOC131233435 isoform X2 n=1 Tax=Magnolia sinica TaxID=86752 RepID=UPI00265910C1|nr:uncharacterized protein LOC131233435 isoform X2 [Magnolia sinica]
MTFRKSFLPRIFSSKEKTISQTDEDSFDSSVAESESTSRLGSLNFSNLQSQMSDISDRRDFRHCAECLSSMLALVLGCCGGQNTVTMSSSCF